MDPAVMHAAVEIAREAGELTLEHFRSGDLSVDSKADGTPVTVADQAAERLIRERLGARFPDDTVLGEEEPDQHGTSARRWIIDPIDGTKAFTHGVPLYTNLLALEDEHGSAVGVINVPALGETVWAGRGLGCFCNGEPARVSSTTEPSGAWATTSGFDSWSPELFARLKHSGMHLRTWGDGYGYVLVATGRIDAMIDPAAALWDVAPMPVIMSEAGGRFSATTGDPSPDAGSGLGTNGVLHDHLLDLFAERPSSDDV
ncbi:MAG: inositol monophosphatase family protein [Acidimicrobiales bacterium]|nr:inositol monophosphatase family protein [Acidimicrobiales bacterium]